MSNVGILDASLNEPKSIIDVSTKDHLEKIFNIDNNYIDFFINNPVRAARAVSAKNDPDAFLEKERQEKRAWAELRLKSVPIIIPYTLAVIAILALGVNSLLVFNNPSATALEKSQAQSNLTSVVVGAIAFIFGKQNSEETKTKNGTT